MWLGPDEAGVDDSSLSKASQLLQTQGKQFSRFWGGDEPAGGWHEPTVTVSAEVEDGLPLDAA